MPPDVVKPRPESGNELYARLNCVGEKKATSFFDREYSFSWGDWRQSMNEFPRGFSFRSKPPVRKRRVVI